MTLPQSADTLEDVRTLALHYQSVAAKQGTDIFRMRTALMIVREWSMRNWDGRAIVMVRDWIDAGMSGPIPWPGGTFFTEWATQHGLSDVDGHIGMRMTATLTVPHA